MKNYRALVPVVLIVMMLASWYMLISNNASVEAEYQNYLTQARKHAENGTKYAVENYMLALEIKDEPDIYVEVAEFFKTQGKMDDHMVWCENFLEKHPTEPKAYDCILESYVAAEDYDDCFDILITAQKRGISTKYITKISSELEYIYKIDFSNYENVGVYSNNFCAVQNDGKWGFVDRYGELRLSCKYTSVGAYTQSNFVSVVNKDGDAYFIDKAGDKVINANGKFTSMGLIVDNIIAAVDKDGNYTYVEYVNADLEKLFGKYEYASTMNGGIAAVKNDGKWQLINNEGKSVDGEKYVDIILDEKQIAYRNDRAFVAKSEGKYIMVDGKGKQIGKLTFEDARMFAGDMPAAVKISGKWCFVGLDGKLVSDKTYADARSYANGLAAVCIDGKWGFVDEKENVVIEAQFFGAKDFNEKGSCFVQTGDKWQLLKLYRLNREG